jgi:hypothetical protein
MEKIEDTGSALVVTIDGDAYQNIRRVVDALNSASWTDGDNTPALLFENWILDLVEDVLHDPAHLAEDILDSVATDDEVATAAPEPVHSQRIADLRAAFVAAGILA